MVLENEKPLLNSHHWYAFSNYLAPFPSIAGTLARVEAKANMQTFAKAVLICEDALGPQLQSSQQSPNESVQVRIITTNNDMTYVLKQDVDSADEWQTYGIQNDNIETIIFEKKSG